MKTFTADLASRINRDKKATEALLQGLIQSIKQHCSELDTVAIPAFGNFRAVKHDEQEIIDRSSGKRMLLPPEIELTFRAAGKLRKLSKGDE